MLWTVLRQTGSRVTEGLPSPALRCSSYTLRTGVLETPKGQFMGKRASKLCCVAGFALKAHLSSSPFARESTRCNGTGFSLLIYAFLTHSHKNGRRQHVLPLYPQLILCSIFLVAAIKIFAIFTFLADKNPRFPICCLLGWLYGSNEGQQPQVWTQILLLSLVSRASSFCFLRKNHQVCPSLLCAPYKARSMGQTQFLRKMPGDTVVGNTCVGNKTNSSDLWQEIISQSAAACRRECLEAPLLVMPAGDVFSLGILRAPEE